MTPDNLISTTQAAGQDQTQQASDNTFNISDAMLPELLDWEDGKTYSIKLKVKQVSKSETDKGSIGTFEIIEANGKKFK